MPHMKSSKPFPRWAWLLAGGIAIAVLLFSLFTGFSLAILHDLTSTSGLQDALKAEKKRHYLTAERELKAYMIKAPNDVEAEGRLMIAAFYNLDFETFSAQFIKLKDSKTIIIDGDYDVFGDKTVTLISTPGHTPGHQCLLVRLPKTGPVLLSGDLYHFPGEREFHTLPQASNAQYVASRAKIEALLEKTGAQLWIQHDIIGNRKLKKSPEYYE